MGYEERAIKIYELIKNDDIEKAKKMITADKSPLDFVTPFGTWLHVATRVGNLQMITFLVESGMDININEGVPKTAPIAHAASEGEFLVVEYLFNKGALLDVSDPNRNPLFSAIYGGHIDIVMYLIQKGIDITVKYTGDTMQDMDAYAFAVERGETEIAAYIKQKLDEKD